MSKFQLPPCKDGFIAYDTETTGLTPYGSYKRWGFYPARPFAYSFCDSEGNTAYVRWSVDPHSRRVQPVARELRQIMGILNDPGITKIGHNLGYDNRMTRFMGGNPQGRMHDTLIMAHIVTGGSLFKYGLKELGEKLLNFPADDEKKLEDATKKARLAAKKEGYCIATAPFFGKKPHKADYWLAPPDLCKTYAIKDAERTMMLYLVLCEQLNKHPHLWEVYKREMKLFHVVAKMENTGVRIFPEKINSLRKIYTDYRSKQRRIADKHGGKGMNFRSSPQKTKIFYTERGYKPIYFTAKTNNPSTNGDSLNYFVSEYKDKLAKAILEYALADHMITGFLDPYDRFKVIGKGEQHYVLHPNYRQCGPVTGRFACGDPNLMQVASEATGQRRTDISLRPREAFGPRNGCIWYLPDYSQIEVWMFSFLAEANTMIDALLSGRDFHESNAEKVWGNKSDYLENKSYYRKRAKFLMFCKLYGGGVKKIAYLTDSTVEDAYDFVNEFDSELPEIKRYMNKMCRQIERYGQITNPLGRTYFIPEKMAYRSVNYMVQGTCADILKNAMIRVDKLFTNTWKGCQMLLTLHDELIIEVPIDLHSKELMRDIVTAMQTDFTRVGLPVPLPVGMSMTNKKWSDAQDVQFIMDEWKEKYICKTKN